MQHLPLPFRHHYRCPDRPFPAPIFTSLATSSPPRPQPPRRAAVITCKRKKGETRPPLFITTYFVPNQRWNSRILARLKFRGIESISSTARMLRESLEPRIIVVPFERIERKFGKEIGGTLIVILFPIPFNRDVVVDRAIHRAQRSRMAPRDSPSRVPPIINAEPLGFPSSDPSPSFILERNLPNL